jgi:hypothetical protein
VSANSTSFTVLASDPDAEPNWTTLALGTGINGLSSLNDGVNTIFNVQQQVVAVVTNLTATDATNPRQTITQTDKSVTIVQGTAGHDVFNPVADTVVGVYYGFGGNDNITGGINADYIFTGGGNDVASGGAGNDSIDVGTGADTLVLGTSTSLNGTDAVVGFTFGIANLFEADILDFEFGVVGGLFNQAALRGDGTSAQQLVAGGALSTNTGLVVAAQDIADAAAAESFIEGLSGNGADYVLFLLTSTNYAGSADTTVYRVDFSAPDTATLTSLAVLSNTTLGQIQQENLANWSLIA